MKKLFALLLIAIFAFSLALLPSAEGNELSYGKSYTLVTPASTAYPDDGLKLTDGIYGTIPEGQTNYYSSNAYVGFNQADVDENGNFVIILDLGETRTDISALTVGFLNEPVAGIYAPKSVTFSLADDRNGEYEELGTLNTEKPTFAESETFALTLAAEDASGRYVKVTIAHLGQFTDDNGETRNAGWTFIDEISVYSSGNSAGDTSGTESTPESTPELDESAEMSPDTSEEAPPEPGDDSASIFVFILLAISATTMLAALFIGKKQRDF